MPPDSLDVLVTAETWHDCSSVVPLRQTVLAGSNIADIPKPRRSNKVRVNHGGIAVLHGNSINSCPVMVPFHQTSFELHFCHLSSIFCKFILSSLSVIDIFFS